MAWLTVLTAHAAPLFLVLSPIFSYGDQALSMSRKRSSAGFSLDIPLIMLVSSLLRIFYYPGAHFDMALLAQSLLMVVVQVVLLKIALDHRPPPSHKGGEAAVPFAGLSVGAGVGGSSSSSNSSSNRARFFRSSSSGGSSGGGGGGGGLFSKGRPYNFWQWRSPKPYWHFLLYLFVGLAVCELVLGPFPDLYAPYSALIGYVGLSVEATLPLPQIYANARARSCRGFRPSVLVNWLAGDAMKMFWFFTATSAIPWSFKLCGLFQAACDIVLGVQYFVYGNGGGPLADGSAGSGLVKEKDEALFRPAAA